MTGVDPDYATRDLFEAIENKNFPSWTLYMQIITTEDIHRHFNYNPFDSSKVRLYSLIDSFINFNILTMHLALARQVSTGESGHTDTE